MDMKTRYVVKGIGKEQTIQSVIAIHTDEQGKISKVEDKWDGKLPDGAISNVSSVFQLLSPFWWINYYLAWTFWLWSFTWETRVWRVGGFLFIDVIHIKDVSSLLTGCIGFPTSQCRHGTKDD